MYITEGEVVFFFSCGEDSELLHISITVELAYMKMLNAEFKFDTV